MKHIISALCLIAILTTVALASDPKSNPNFMPTDQIKPGMKGYGMSVFKAQSLNDSRSRYSARS